MKENDERTRGRKKEERRRRRRRGKRREKKFNVENKITEFFGFFFF